MTMPKGRPITHYERERIETYLRMKKKKKWIADKLGRDYSVIKRETKRNAGEHLPYIAKTAQEYADRRATKTNVRKLEKWQNKKLQAYVHARLGDGWSPEEIAGVLVEQPPKELRHCKDRSVSYESIYDYIYNGQGRIGTLYTCLRRKSPVRKVQKGRKRQGKTLIPQRVSITERDLTDEIGHWETDSVLYSGKSILSVQYEKRSMLCRLHKCPDKSARASEDALQDSIESLPGTAWKTITRDNGTENVLHHTTDVPSFFCDPYSSWQKGGVENLNGLIREYFPKGSNLDTVEESEIYLIQEKLNNRPRKSLNYLTPNEFLATEL